MELKQIAEGVYYSAPEPEIDQPCLYAVVGGVRTLMIDGGVSPEKARGFIAALRGETGRGADYAVATHWHWDHTFGLPGVDAPVVACAETAAHMLRLAAYASWSDEALEERLRSGEEIEACAVNIKKVYPCALRGSIAIRQPDIVFTGGLAFDLGGVSCLLERMPRVHTNDSVSVWVPERSVLFIGDSVWPNSYERPRHYSAPAVLAFLDYVRGKRAAVVAESHSLPTGTEEFLAIHAPLETAARAVLGGLHDGAGLYSLLAAAGRGVPEEDLRELAELFAAGVGR